MKAKTEYIDKRRALELLESNVGNRTLRHRHASSLADDMTSGLWQNNGESIKFSNTGRLIDGQHRLAAIAIADVRLPILVISGVRDDAQHTLDCGSARQAHDFANVKNARNVVAALRLICRMTEAKYRSANMLVTNAVIKTMLDDEYYSGLGDALADVKAMKKRTGLQFPDGAAALALWVSVCTTGDAESLDSLREFCGQLATGEMVPPGAPALALRKALASGVLRKLWGQDRSVATYNAFRSAMEKHVAGAAVRVIRADCSVKTIPRCEYQYWEPLTSYWRAAKAGI